ncbi:MAG: hypothetical protein AAF541_15815 [Pseudomonadota bacterium]
MRPLLTAAITCVLAACVSYQSDSGKNAHQYQHVIAGETTTGWLHQHFGPPDAIDQTRNGSEMWRYDHERTEETEVSLFILFDFSNTSSRTESHYFEVLDGIVINYWRE